MGQFTRGYIFSLRHSDSVLKWYETSEWWQTSHKSGQKACSCFTPEQASETDIYIYIPDNKTKRCAYWYNLVLIVLYLWVCVYIYNICMLIYTLHLYIHMCLSLCVAISNMSWLASGGEGGLKGWPCLPVAGFQLPGDQRLLSSYHESMFFFSQW